MKLTRHHCVPRSIGGCNCKGNIVMISEKEHREYHKKYVNAHPWEVIKLLERRLEQERRKGIPPKSTEETEGR